MSGKRLFIIGGSGFIGQSFLRYLGKTTKYKTVVYDLKTPEFFVPDEYHPGRVEDINNLGSVLRPQDIVIHLAHTTIPVESENEPRRELEENLLPWFNLLWLFRDVVPSRIIFSSTGGNVYGEPPQRVPIKEDDPKNPKSIHGLTKLMMEKQLSTIASKLKISWVVMRISNPYGPFQERLNRHGAISNIFRALAEERTFTVYGDGETVRDYIYIDDVSEALKRLIERDVEGFFNIGTGKGTTLNQVIKLAETITGKKLRIKFEPIRATDLKYNVLDVEKLKQETGWKVRYSLKKGMQISWEYWRKSASF